MRNTRTLEVLARCMSAPVFGVNIAVLSRCCHESVVDGLFSECISGPNRTRRGDHNSAGGSAVRALGVDVGEQALTATAGRRQFLDFDER